MGSATKINSIRLNIGIKKTKAKKEEKEQKIEEKNKEMNYIIKNKYFT